jgi:DNA helicase HerA-like ATPase
VHLGQDPLGKPVTWDTAANPGFGILVTGDTGFGKTQTLRVVIAEVRAAGLPALIFDYKPDYIDAAFVEAHGFSVYDVKRRGLPFNPLALMPDKNGEVYPYDQIYELAEIFRRVLQLGEQQENRIVEAQAAAYRACGWDPQAYSRFDKARKFPTFADVMHELESMKKDTVAKTTFTRLKKFLDMKLFPSKVSDTTFDDLMGQSVVLAMNELPMELANTLSEVLIVKLHGTLRRGAQPRKLQRLLVFDEAWRVKGSSKLTELAREGRAFGVGLAIGTQNPKDLPQELVSCLRAQLFLCNKDPDNQKAIARAVCGQASGREAQRIIDQVKGLAKFQGLIISEQYKDGRRVNVVPYSDRAYSAASGG